MQSHGRRIEISISEQKLRLIGEDGVLAEYAVSTSSRGTGTEEGSFRTPTGEFEISEKIGEGQEPGTIFKGRKPVGVWNPGTETDGDLVLTRILRLDGLSAENANTRSRYIYIHGTNQEDRIGSPASDGCIRMRNCDVVDLFDRVDDHVPVSIA